MKTFYKKYHVPRCCSYTIFSQTETIILHLPENSRKAETPPEDVSPGRRGVSLRKGAFQRAPGAWCFANVRLQRSKTPLPALTSANAERLLFSRSPVPARSRAFGGRPLRRRQGNGTVKIAPVRGFPCSPAGAREQGERVYCLPKKSSSISWRILYAGSVVSGSTSCQVTDCPWATGLTSLRLLARPRGRHLAATDFLAGWMLP